MIGVALALVVVGIVFLFVIPWVGIPIGAVGILLALAWFVNFLRAGARSGSGDGSRA